MLISNDPLAVELNLSLLMQGECSREISKQQTKNKRRQIMGWIWANLDKKGMDAVQQLEDKLGKRILALYPDFIPEKINEDELQQIQTLEKQLNVDLVAVVSHN